MKNIFFWDRLALDGSYNPVKGHSLAMVEEGIVVDGWLLLWLCKIDEELVDVISCELCQQFWE